METYIARWRWRKSHALAILNNRVAQAMQVQIHILAFMNPNLTCHQYQYAVPDTGDVNRPIHVTSYNERA